MANYKVGVKMRLKNILDVSAVLSGPLQIRRGAAQWVDDGGFPVTLNVISALGKATSVYLIDGHVAKGDLYDGFAI